MSTPVGPGDPLNIQHGDWNGLMDMLAWWKRTGRSQASRGNRALEAVLQASQTRAFVKNTSSTNRNRHEILGLGGSPLDYAYADYKNTLALNGTTPTTSSHTGRFCVCLEPIPAGKFGWAVVSGVTQAKLNITTTGDQWAEVTNNNGSYLTTSTSGSAQVLDPTSGTGQRLGIIRIGTPGVVLHRGVTDAAINKAASGTVSRYLPGTTTDSGTNDTVFNDYADVAISKKCAYIQSGANFYMIAAECA